MKMETLLIQKGLLKNLKGKEVLWAKLSNEAKEDLLDWAHSAILFSLLDEVLQEVLDESSAAELWLKLENLNMTKSLTDKLYLKQCLYTLHMLEGTPIKKHLDKE